MSPMKVAQPLPAVGHLSRSREASPSKHLKSAPRNLLPLLKRSRRRKASTKSLFQSSAFSSMRWICQGSCRGNLQFHMTSAAAIVRVWQQRLWKTAKPITIKLSDAPAQRPSKSRCEQIRCTRMSHVSAGDLGSICIHCRWGSPLFPFFPPNTSRQFHQVPSSPSLCPSPAEDMTFSFGICMVTHGLQLRRGLLACPATKEL